MWGDVLLKQGQVQQALVIYDQALHEAREAAAKQKA